MRQMLVQGLFGRTAEGAVSWVEPEVVSMGRVCVGEAEDVRTHH
jgi:hypothetical protein